MKATEFYLGLGFVLFFGLSSDLTLAKAKADEDASDPEFPCHPSRLSRVKVPWDPSRPDTKRVTYYFEKTEGSEPTAPTVVILPGGPGGTSIGQDSSVPRHFPQLRIDPRGAGCNAIPYPATSYRSEILASDAQAAIRSLGLKNYVIFGSSYGSVWATHLAHLLEADGGPVPRSVILASVFGRATRSREEDELPYLKLWSKVSGELHPDARAKLKSDATPFGVSADILGSWVTELLMESSSQGLLVTRFNLLQPRYERLLKKTGQEIEKEMAATREEDEAMNEELYRRIACEELYSALPYTSVGYGSLKMGELVFEGENYCLPLKLDRPFDAKSFKLRTKLFYLVGELDPRLPPWQAEYHFHSQALASRTLLEVSGAGHSVFEDLSSCRDELWDFFTAETPALALDAVIEKCRAPIRKMAARAS